MVLIIKVWIFKVLTILNHGRMIMNYQSYYFYDFKHVDICWSSLKLFYIAGILKGMLLW